MCSITIGTRCISLRDREKYLVVRHVLAVRVELVLVGSRLAGLHGEGRGGETAVVGHVAFLHLTLEAVEVGGHVDVEGLDKEV